MNTNQYSSEDLEIILSRIPKPNIPQILYLILLSRDYEKLTDDQREYLISYINLINNLDPDFRILARNKIILALKKKIKNEERVLAKAVFQNRINELEKSRTPIIEFERLISTKFSERYLEETITVDVNTGRKKCAIYIRTYVSKNLNKSPWEYGGTLFEMPSWC